MRGAKQKQEAAHQLAAWQAWHIAALPRAKKFPSLDKFVTGKSAKADKQPPEVLQAMCDALAIAWGAKKA